MILRIVTPLMVVVDENANGVRAEDASGSFGILPGHAAFLTSLALSVVEWVPTVGGRRYCAVRGGMLSVLRGHAVAVATREAIVGDDIATLDATVLARFRADADRDRSERFDSSQLQLSAIRRMVGEMQAGDMGGTLFS